MSLLNVEKLTVRFGGLTAVNDLSFSVEEGQIVSIIGPNGAGKTTVFNVITGIYQPTSGEILISGKAAMRAFSLKVFVSVLALAAFTAVLTPVFLNVQSLWDATISNNYIFEQSFHWPTALKIGSSFFFSLSNFQLLTLPLLAAVLSLFAFLSIWLRARRTPEVVALYGLERTFQNIRLFWQMTVIQNILVGMDKHLKSGLLSSLFQLHSFKKEEAAARQRAIEILDFVGLGANANVLASSLSYGLQRRLEIARALAGKPKLLLLDEPAAGMNPSEAESLVDLIRQIRDRGITILLIEHHMKVVMGISDKIVVLDYGNKIAEGDPLEIKGNSRVIEAYLGAGSGRS